MTGIGAGRTPHHHISARGFQIDGLYHPPVSLVLASASPRRRELLASAGIAFDVEPVDVDERREPGEAPEAYVERVARLKAGGGARRHPARAVLGADTVVVVDGEVLGKPASAADAARMLRRLSGRAHAVLTGVALAWQGRITSRVERTDVVMSPISEDDLAWYVASGEPLDKAGAYAIQGLASRFVTRIEGSYSNVVGLPVATVVELLTTWGGGFFKN
jgi:septum formation protein